MFGGGPGDQLTWDLGAGGGRSLRTARYVNGL